MLFLILTGLVMGAAVILLASQGNPSAMGFYIACFLRDISGALGLHRAGSVQHLRPESAGLGHVLTVAKVPAASIAYTLELSKA